MTSKRFPFMGYLATSAGQLPLAPPPALFGRDAPLQRLDQLISERTAVLLCGPEGVGKTALAATLAAQQAPLRSGGVVWLNAAFDALSGLCDQVGQAYAHGGILNAPDAEEQVVRTRDLLAEQGPLVVIDNVSDAGALESFVQRVAAGLPAIALAEAPSPGPWALLPLERLSREASVALFHAHAGLADAEDTNGAEGAVCALLEDLPLAVEVAARLARIDGLTPADLHATLSSVADAPAPALRALSVAFERMPPGEQALTLVAGVTFAAGGTPAALGAIVEVGAPYASTAIRRLESRGLGRVVTVAGHSLLTLHSVAYRFARATLEQGGDPAGRKARLHDAETRAVAAFAGYARRHRADDDALLAEWGNLLGALDWAARAGDLTNAAAIGEALVGSRLLTAQGHARLRGQFAAIEASAPTAPPAEAPELAWAGGALVSAGDQRLAAGELDAAEAAFTEALGAARAPAGEPNLLIEGRVLARLGEVNAARGRHDRAAEYYRQAAIAAHKAKDPATEGAAMASMGVAFARLGRPDHAADAFRRAIPVLLSASQERRIARTYYDLARTLADAGELDEAGQTYQRAAEAARAAGEPALRRDALMRLGDARRARQQHELAISAYRQALDLSRELGDRSAEQQALGAVGQAYLSLGEPEVAVSYLVQAVKGVTGASDAEREWVGALANAYHELGEDEKAVAAYESAIELAHATGNRRNEASYHNSLGLALSRLGRIGEALEHYQQALTLARALKARADQAGFLNNIGLVYMELGEVETAIVYYQQSLEISRQLGDRERERDALGNIGVAYSRLARWAAALEHHTRALSIAREMDSLHDQGRQLGNIGLAHEALGQRARALQAYKEALDIAYRLDDVDQQAALLHLLGALLMDNVPYLAEAVSMLEESYNVRQRSGRSHALATETLRLLNRARKRLERAQRAGLHVLAATAAEERQAAGHEGARRGAVRRALASAAGAVAPPDQRAQARSTPPKDPFPEPPPDLPA